jgi:hypothetical protein
MWATSSDLLFPDLAGVYFGKLPYGDDKGTADKATGIRTDQDVTPLPQKGQIVCVFITLFITLRVQNNREIPSYPAAV